MKAFFPAHTLIAASVFFALPATTVADTANRPGTHAWVERPWNMQYVVIVQDADDAKRRQAWAKKKNAEAGNDYLVWNELFEATWLLDAAPSPVRDHRFAVTVIAFDREGFVTSPHTHAGPLRGRLNRLLYVTLSTGDEPAAPLYDLGSWFLGLGDASTHWAPGLCKNDERPSPFSATDTAYRYNPRFKADSYSTTFGCREWAYQLYDDERPYIDVTSYVPKDRYLDKGAYIRQFIGWARFGDKKPVIGKHEDHWYCLHDCPGQDMPGRIADINEWAKANGWSAPKRPTKMPVFPDPPAKPVDYPK